MYIFMCIDRIMICTYLWCYAYGALHGSYNFLMKIKIEGEREGEREREREKEKEKEREREGEREGGHIEHRVIVRG